MSTEMQRILRLPEVSYPRTGASDALRPAQRACLRAWLHALETPPDKVWGPPGLAALLGCGHGKTLVSLLLPALAGYPRTLHLVPARLKAQLNSDIEEWRERLPEIVFDERAIESHEKLSSRSGKGLLGRVSPELLILDEAHAFSDPKSARWRRIAQYVDAHPHCRVVILSGSITWRSLLQCQHLFAAALRAWAPVPLNSEIYSWAGCIDLGGTPTMADSRSVEPLRKWAGGLPVRQAYRKRLRTCPGVIVSSDVGVGVGLAVTCWKPRAERTAEAEAAVDLAERRWELPDGTELVSVLEQQRHLRTLSLGLYLRWVPPWDPDWLDARRAWAREANNLRLYGGYMTIADAEYAAKAGGLPQRAQAVWENWQRYRHYPDPPVEPVWVDGGETLARWVAEAAGPKKPSTIIWVQTPIIGERAAEVLGVPYHGAGSAPPSGGHAVVSIRVHGRGWNGQDYARAVVLESPSGAAAWEQLLARQHRAGQTKDVEYFVLGVDPHHMKNLYAGVAGARYVEHTTGADQRLLYCDRVAWDRDTLWAK